MHFSFIVRFPKTRLICRKLGMLTRRLKTSLRILVEEFGDAYLAIPIAPSDLEHATYLVLDDFGGSVGLGGRPPRRPPTARR